MFVAFAIAALMSFNAWFNPDKAALRGHGAKIVSQGDAPQLFEIVDRLSQRAKLPTARIAIAQQAQPNACATGRNEHNAVVCVTAGLLERLDLAELEAVLAHELAHIKNRDMLLQTFSATLAGAVWIMSRFGAYGGGMRGEGRGRGNPLALFLAPIAAMWIQFAIRNVCTTCMLGSERLHSFGWLSLCMATHRAAQCPTLELGAARSFHT